MPARVRPTAQAEPSSVPPTRTAGVVLLKEELVRERLMDRASAVGGDVAEQPRRALPVVKPARVVGDGVEADALDRNAERARLRDLAPHEAEPGGALAGLDARLGDDHGAAIASVDVAQDLMDRTEPGVVDFDQGAVVDLLVVGVVVHADDGEVVRPSAEHWPDPARDPVPDLVHGGRVLARVL